MTSIRPTLAAVLLAALASTALAQESTPPAEEAAPEIARGLVFRVGVAGIVLPEASNGTFSAQPEVRFGWFLQQRVAIQIEGSARVWPLGGVAARSYGLAGNVLWFPPLGREGRELYLLAGGGGAYTDPAVGDTSFDPAIRGGIGVLAPLAGLVPSLAGLRLAVEYRGELVRADETDFVSGISIGVSRNL